jgi:site-specific DNA-methyltransferase (adenine-specific)
MISFLDGRVILYPGDCLDALAAMPENSVDAVVCDPPYHLHSITKRFAKTGRTDKTRTKSGPHQRTARGFMNKLWDGGDVAFRVETWKAVFHVLKPGGYVLAFASTRGFGRMSVAIEDAGFITHPLIAWIFGSGFPKAHNAARAIDKELGREGEKMANGNTVRRIRPGADQNKDGSWEKLEDRVYQPGAYVPGSAEAARWNGWHYGGQSLKPAIEPIYMGQKPFTERNGAANILFWETGAVNIDACRVHAPDGVPKFTHRGEAALNCYGDGKNGSNRTGEIDTSTGRWPANVIHDGSDEVIACFPQVDGQIGGNNDPNGTMGYHGGANGITRPGVKDTGSAARFFYAARPDEPSALRRYDKAGATDFAMLPGARRAGVPPSSLFYSAKADAEDRIGSKHPTVKPVDLMQYLVRLVTPPGGTVLDPFAGTGTTGEAAWREGFNAILVEREPEYQQDIAERMRLCLAGPDEKAREIIKRSGKAELDAGPLFGGAA